jgi:lycopene beta-cyclase
MDSRERVIFVGGGLANGLAAYRLFKTRPQVPFLLLEQGPSLGGDHTWSCHGADLLPEARAWMAPLMTQVWPRHEVRFPNLTRVFESPYMSIRSPDFQRHLMAWHPGDRNQRPCCDLGGWRAP